MDKLKYYDVKLNEIPKDVLDKAVSFLRSYLTDKDTQDINKEISEKGLMEWAMPYHFGWGMAIRNLLRTEADLKDDLLPDGNWDDYYIQCVEIAVGKRIVE